MTGTNDIDGQTADAQAVAQLVLRERQSRDRGWWDDMANCFTPDAVIDMSWFIGPASEFVRLTRERSANGVWGRHRLSPPTVRIIGDQAWAELPLGVEFRMTVNGVEADLVSDAAPSTGQSGVTAHGVSRGSPRSTNATPSPQRYPGRHSASIPWTSPRSGPPTAAWPGTSTKRAPRWAATCLATTA